VDSLYLIVGIFVFGLSQYYLGRFICLGSKWPWILIIFVSIIGSIFPVILIKEEIVAETAANVLIAGFSFFYMAIAAGRISKKINNR